MLADGHTEAQIDSAMESRLSRPEQQVSQLDKYAKQ
jgi:hypothetical protein